MYYYVGTVTLALTLTSVARRPIASIVNTRGNPSQLNCSFRTIQLMPNLTVLFALLVYGLGANATVSTSCRFRWRTLENRSSPGGRYVNTLHSPESCLDDCKSDSSCIGYEIDRKTDEMKCWIHHKGESLMEAFSVEDFRVQQTYLVSRCWPTGKRSSVRQFYYVSSC